MRRMFAIGTLVSSLCVIPASAILDTNSNGLSDLWERAYNCGQLFPSMNLQTDDDGDGWTNEQEAAAGTNPFDPNPPDGIIRPETVHIPESWSDINGDGFDEHTLEAIQVTWPQIPGKVYTLLFSPDLVDWLQVGEAFIGSDTEQVYNFPLSQIEGQDPPPDKQFWRVKVEDVDSDGDGLTNAEEAELGTNPTIADSDCDGLSDLAEILAGTDPNNPDSDNDGLTDGEENALGTDPNNTDIIGPVNFGFNDDVNYFPDMSFRPKNPSDLYQQDGFPGWQAASGDYIEVWDEGAGNRYVELQSHFRASGVKQEFNMLPGSRLVFIVRYKGRYELCTPYENAFKLEVEGASGMLVNGSPAEVADSKRHHSFMEDDDWEKYKDWHYASVSISTAPGTTGLTQVTLKLVPLNTSPYDGEEITRGGFVDFLPVEIEQQNYRDSMGIRFCRWLDAFSGSTFDDEFADKDRDRFRIRIPSIIPNLTRINIESTGLHYAVIDGVVVEKTTDGNYEVEMKQENGAMVSTWILLVSDGDDDKNYNGKGTNDGDNDQTLLADFESKIIVSFPEFDSVGVEFSAQKAVGNVTLDTVYLSPAGDVPSAMLDLITRQVIKMQEIYRQIGIRVAWASIDGATISQTMLDAVPNPDPAKPDLEEANLLNNSECQAVRTQIRGWTVPDKHVRIGYVNATMRLLQNFIPVYAMGFTDLGSDGIVVSLRSTQAQLTLGVTAHEVGHAFGLDDVAPGHLLMKSEMIWLNGKRDPKRFEEGNYNTIKNKEAFYVPFQ